MSVYVNYSLDASIADFFTKTSVTREVCDVKAASLVGGCIIPVPVQGSCSYTVYGGLQSEFVVQFRLESLPLNLRIAALARKIHGNLAPATTYHEQLGDINQEPVFVYSMDRIRGLSYLEFYLANKYAANSEENFSLRANLIVDLAR